MRPPVRRLARCVLRALDPTSVYLLLPQGLWLPQLASKKIGSPGDHGIPRHRFTDKKNGRIWWSGLDGTHVFLHTIPNLTVLSSTTTVDQMELDSALTRYLAHDWQGMRVPPLPPRNIFLNPCVSGVRPQVRVIHSHVVPTEVFPQAHVECARDEQRGPQDAGVPEHEPQQGTMSMAT